jgi:cytochrome c-type biogenesis protein CcsB
MNLRASISFSITLLSLLASFSVMAADTKSAPKAAAPQAQQAAPAQTAPPMIPAVRHPDWNFEGMRLVPIQSGGRVKPFGSFAEEAVLSMTGRKVYDGWDPVDLVLSWLTYPVYWQSQKFIKIVRVDVRRELTLEESRTAFAPDELFNNFPLIQYAQTMEKAEMGTAEPLSGKTDRGGKDGPREQELKALLQRMILFKDIVAGTGWTIVPQADGKTWMNLTNHDPAGVNVRNAFVDMVKSYQGQNADGFTKASDNLAEVVSSTLGSIDSTWGAKERSQLKAEVIYNRVHPFQFAWILYLASAILALMAPKSKTSTTGYRWAGICSLWGFIAAIGFHLLGVALRCYVAGRPPVTNMYESIIWVSFGTVLFALILYRVQKNPITLIISSVLATVGLIAADSAPAMMDPGLHPLVPVLRSNYWLTIHVLTITLSYSAFALTLGLANVTLFNFLKLDRARAVGDQASAQAAQARVSGLNLLTYRAMQFGIVLVAAGTILGGVWADYSWGRFWGWDPKEVWALVVLLTYLAIVHGRMTQWIGPFAFAVTSVMGFLSVLMAWYGVNFILGVGLHAYGFSSGGTGWIVGFTSAQLAYVAIVAALHFGYFGKGGKPLNSPA